MIVLMLVLVPGLLRNLPNPTLAAVVIAASLSLADMPGTVRLWRQRRVEFVLSVAAFVGVALLGVLPGHRRRRRPFDPQRVPPGMVALQTTLGRVPGVPGYHDREQYPEAEELPGLVIFRFDAQLFFANARTFREQIRRLAAARAAAAMDRGRRRADHRRGHDRGRHARPTSTRSSTPAGISLVFAELKDPVRAKIERYELIGPIDPDHFFPTLEAAIDHFRRATNAEWTPLDPDTRLT